MIFFFYLLLFLGSICVAQQDITSKLFLKDGTICTGTIEKYVNGVITFRTKYGVLRVDETDALCISISKLPIDFTRSLQITMSNGDVITGKILSYKQGSEVKVKTPYGKALITDLSNVALICLGASVDYDLWQSLKPSTWRKVYEGEGSSWVEAMWPTTDDGCVVAGCLYPFYADKSDKAYGCIVKFDEYGNVIWQKTYLRNTSAKANSIQQTADGGYIVAGCTSSLGLEFSDEQPFNDGHIISSYAKSVGSTFSSVNIMKLDKDGNLIWQRIYDTGGSSEAICIEQTYDGGYVVAGFKQDLAQVFSDVYVLRVDKDGNLVWQRTYGGDKEDMAYSIQQTSDRGFIIVGFTESFGAKGKDVYILKLDSDGNPIWQETRGENADDVAYSVQEVDDGNYIIAGYTTSAELGTSDICVTKIDENGNVLWEKKYGGDKDDVAFSIKQANDGGYVFTGWTNSFGDISPRAYIFKIDSTGDVEWQKVFSDGDSCSGKAIGVLDDGYIMAGWVIPSGSNKLEMYISRTNVNGNT